MEKVTAWSTPVTDALGIALPVILAPMGGGPSTPALVAAVSNAGGLGSLAGGYLRPERLRKEIARVRQLTSLPFAVNLFAGRLPEADAAAVERAMATVAPLRQELGLSPYPTLSSYGERLDEQLESVVEARPPVVSFTFGLLDPAAVDRLHDAGSVLIGTATTVAEAVAIQRASIDAVCVQGAEAGAHRGTFLDDPDHSLVGTLALVPQVRDAVSIPVIASGGVMDGRGLAAVLALGAGAAQLGTAFLRCPEAGTSAPYRQALAGASDISTSLSSTITGRMARGIDNRLMRVLAGCDVPPYPVMNAITTELRRTATARDVAELMSLWCGQGAPLGTELPAAELVRRIATDAAALLRRLCEQAPLDQA